MSPAFRDYSENLISVRLRDLLGTTDLDQRMARARPSLIVNPLSRKPYKVREQIEAPAE